MSSRSKTVSRLLNDKAAREAYLRAKLNQLIPSQIRGLRRREEWTQKQLGVNASMKQARISAMEKPGEVSYNVDTLIRLAAAFRVGLEIKFVPLSGMVQWERTFSQDAFEVNPIEKDISFLFPDQAPISQVKTSTPQNGVFYKDSLDRSEIENNPSLSNVNGGTFMELRLESAS